jgi:hypothetical protein
MYMNIRDVKKNHPIYKFSNPELLRSIADKKGYINDEIYLSDKKDKKYMLFHPITNKKIHFGQANYEDYLKHNDEKRRQNFKNRNKRWKDNNKYSSSYISYFLTW